MVDKKTEIHVIETDDSLYSVEIDANGHTIIGDQPTKGFNSKNLGPAPGDLLAAALGECTAMTLRWLAIQNKWPLEKAEVHVVYEKTDKEDVFTKQVTIHGDELTKEQRQKLLQVANKCPVHKTLANGATIK